VAVAVEGLNKRYGGVVALDEMNLTVHRGTIHAVVGENGAGKSSLMKILAGVESADSGTISLDGAVVNLGTPKAAQALRIGIVFQELSLFPDRSVLANLFVNDEPTRMGFISRRLMRRRAAPLLARVGLDVDVAAPVRDLSIGERQLVELCRVLGESPRLLILDEPNSALSGTETARLFTVLRELRQGGITVLYVSHRLEEVFEIADRVTVMRNGREVMTRERAGLKIADVVQAMIGRREDELFPPPLEAGARSSGRLMVRDLSVKDRLAHITCSVEAGEILGLAGLRGPLSGRAGRTPEPDARGEAGDQPGTRRSPAAGSDAAQEHCREHRPRVRRDDARPVAVAFAGRAGGDGQPADQKSADQDADALGRGKCALRREPAKDRPRKVARGSPQRGVARRPHARRRRRGEARDLSAHSPACLGGTDRAVQLYRIARADRAV
jgi:ribose transport system ATP-binding protein